jgi:5'-nucleotidase/UDP-sugar diphosphatase
VTLLHFSDYHSHALPFYSEDRRDQGGIARAIAYMRAAKRDGALVFSGGDMINKGSPAWSDKYQCAEWSWLDGVINAMAFGNHDPDYGREIYDRCALSVHFPILSANTAGFEASVVIKVRGTRIGVFALAGNDFKSLVKVSGFTFSDPIAAARATVRELREEEHVDAVIMIGHEHLDDDMALAKAVPGIDVIFGSHSHLKRELQKIDGTSTWFISPFQYLTYISRVELTIDNHHVTNVRGRLVRIDKSIPADPTIVRRVAEMQRELEADPQYASLFAPIATLKSALSVDALGQRTVEVMRNVSHADVALSTASSFRQPLPPGVLNFETLRAAMPYDNEIVVASMSGARLKELLAYSESRRGTDSFSYVAKPDSIDPDRTYKVAATDFLARVAQGYRDFFKEGTPTGLKVREELRRSLTQ